MQVILSAEEWEAMKNAGRDNYVRAVKDMRLAMVEELRKCRTTEPLGYPVHAESPLVRLTDVVTAFNRAADAVEEPLKKHTK